jgi:hypothetical protein
MIFRAICLRVEMMKKNDNKVDAVIDEVVTSRYLSSLGRPLAAIVSGLIAGGVVNFVMHGVDGNNDFWPGFFTAWIVFFAVLVMMKKK